MGIKERNKARMKCPKCNSGRIWPRTTKTPKWKCCNGHTFDFPLPLNLLDARR